MFLSTVVPTTRLNIDNQNYLPYQFSVPYNFVRGRNISVNINPQSMQNHGNNSLTNGNGTTTVASTSFNNFVISIPDNVTEYTANVNVSQLCYISNSVIQFTYNINIVCDLVNQTITFAPLQTTRTPVSGGYPQYYDATLTASCLITIATIM